MPIDRAAALRNAEKLLRQGQLDQAIDEYVRVVEDQPGDWNTANLLGDLYVRAGQRERAIGAFMRTAEVLLGEGHTPRANAVYKKILKLEPDHEGALLKASEIASRQGLLVDVKGYLTRVAGVRRANGDAQGVAEIEARIASIGRPAASWDAPDETDIEIIENPAAVPAAAALSSVAEGAEAVTAEAVPAGATDAVPEEAASPSAVESVVPVSDAPAPPAAVVARKPQKHGQSEVDLSGALNDLLALDGEADSQG